MYRLISSIAAIVLAMAPVFAYAGDTQGQATELPEILAQQKQIQADVKADKGLYPELNPLRKRKVLEAQDQVFKLAEGHAQLSELTVDDQLRLFNALKLIEAYLGKRNEDDHMICERAVIAGTHRPEMACMTRAERDRHAEGAKATLMNRQACTTAACFVDH